MPSNNKVCFGNPKHDRLLCLRQIGASLSLNSHPCRVDLNFVFFLWETPSQEVNVMARTCLPAVKAWEKVGSNEGVFKRPLLPPPPCVYSLFPPQIHAFKYIKQHCSLVPLSYPLLLLMLVELWVYLVSGWVSVFFSSQQLAFDV